MARLHWAGPATRSTGAERRRMGDGTAERSARVERVSITVVSAPGPAGTRRRTMRAPRAGKPAIDGFTAAGVLKGDDSPRYVPVSRACIGKPCPRGRLCCTSPRSPIRPRQVRREPPARGRLCCRAGGVRRGIWDAGGLPVGVNLAPPAELPVRVHPGRRTQTRRGQGVHVASLLGLSDHRHARATPACRTAVRAWPTRIRG